MTSELSGARWFKSVHSDGGEACVEIAWIGAGQVGVRDSKNPTGSVLIFMPHQWDAFIARVTGGRLNLHSNL
ncbi:DUF397 domain-containing protein [Nocardia beijingensis]|uniref:DUF397 domain-containing protein n=1 Tax=Nocardia beijingensis TaxID=95162 RepID=UPI0033F07F52